MFNSEQNSDLMGNMEIVDSFESTATTADNTYTKDVEVGQIAIVTIGYLNSATRVQVSNSNAILLRTTAKAYKPVNLDEQTYWHTVTIVQPTKETGSVTITAPWGAYWTALSCVVLE